MPDSRGGCIGDAATETLSYNRQEMTANSYATIVVTGSDALDFLQGQLTADLRGKAPGDRLLAAWCNPRGRVICLFRICVTADGFRLVLPDELAAGVERRLTMFRFRSKVDLATEPATRSDLDIGDDTASWRLGNLRDGIPEIGTAQSEKFTPHMLNLDLLGAVSFDKGCYTGQEVVARTHYRGATRRRMLRFESEAPLEPGTRISDGERDIGEVLNAIGTDLLAVVPAASADATLTADGTALRHVPLPYLD